ncbi:N-acetylmuramic acid 6-phosphate etherase [Pseudogracilibacillus sp. SO30301A]|uniref:N-acetylmuramic acid 6-phosphate etherase n=1 Tax=Pseudogracilibacillus sp. SO30301A TaxID=3098291 RepID=UPI00300E5ED2
MNKFVTEMRNSKSENLHERSVFEIIQLINKEDKVVADIVGEALPQIELVINKMIETIENGGRVIYFGAGTSGRLGVLDASECPPTFGVSPDVFKGVIAGGDSALRFAVENAEDSKELGVEDVNTHVVPKDLVVGIASSGQTPYVIGVVEQARKLGAYTVGLSCNPHSFLSDKVDIAVELPVGPEVITGSTRMKAGTAQKMVLNIFSTTTMIKTGKIYKNLMVNVQATNEKLRKRAASIISDLTGADEKKAREMNDIAQGDTRVAILMILFDVELEKAKSIIKKYNGNFVKAMQELSS